MVITLNPFSSVLLWILLISVIALLLSASAYAILQWRLRMVKRFFEKLHSRFFECLSPFSSEVGLRIDRRLEKQEEPRFPFSVTMMDTVYGTPYRPLRPESWWTQEEIEFYNLGEYPGTIRCVDAEDTTDPLSPSYICRFPLAVGGQALPMFWRSVDHAFAAQAFDQEEHILHIHGAKSREEVYNVFESVDKRPDWSQHSTLAMYRALRAKFFYVPECREALLQIGEDAIALVGSGEDYWGYGSNGTGSNVIGRTMLSIREELINANSSPVTTNQTSS